MLLDGVGELSARLQQKLLRALQEEAVRPVGADTPQPVNIRVISTTTTDLQADTVAGKFREDLFYRLNGGADRDAPLARRREDIPLLIAHFLALNTAETGQRSIFRQRRWSCWPRQDWPGNVRQLQNLVQQTAALAQTPIIPVELVQQSLGGAAGR